MASPKLTIAELLATPLSSSDAAFSTNSRNRHSQLVELINTPVGDEYFSSTIDALRETDVTSILIGRLPSGRAVPPHRGDKRICRIHLGLIVPDGDVAFTCRGEDRKWEKGKCLAFNDFYEHSARNNTEYDRVNLIVDTLR